MSENLSEQRIDQTYQKILHIGDDGVLYNGTGSIVAPILSGSVVISGSLFINGRISANAGMLDSAFEMTSEGDLTPRDSINIIDMYYEINADGDIMPREG